jgi:parvulin-like peptidyl-prolyl isomerase
MTSPRPILALALALSLTLPSATVLLAPVRAAELVNGIAALVGNSVITYEQVERFIARAVELFRVQYAAQPDVLRDRILEARRRGVETLVERRLILQDFEDLKVNLPESIIEDNIEAEIRQRFGDRPTLIRTLQEQGVTTESFRRDIRDQFIEAVMRNRNVPRDILISPGRIERYYRENEEQFRIADQVRLRMIVLDKSRNPVDALRLGREIIAKLDEGAEFAEMAAVYSEGSQAREGGLWGWVDRKVLREDLAEIAFSLPSGQRSDLIEKAEAVYLMLVEENRPAFLKPIDEVRDEIERTLVTTERTRLQKDWIERLRKKTFVRYF